MLRPGDELPEASAVPPPPGYDEIQRQELSRLFGRMVGIRLFVIPLAAVLALCLALLDPSRWRAALLVALVVPAGIFFASEALRYRRRGFQPEAVTVNLAAMVAGQLGIAFATGALESPFTYTFVPLAVMIGIFSSRRARWPLVATQIVGVWALAAVEMTAALPDLNLAAFGGGPRAGHLDAHLVSTGIILSLVLAFGSRAGRGVRSTFDGMLARALRAQQDSLRAYAERTEELTALSGEIAHELKNPLASVKGLAALLAESVPAGKGAERLGVLRREVDRMQGILDEFLNFSRPLVPLALGRVDLGALAREVAALHEGMAHERGVRIEVRAARAEARCDPRKVKQVLVNLVQNALEASAPGEAVELEVPHAAGRTALVRVLDRGSGLDATLGPRVFEPGVTSKALGSGLGLTIARALARQHGGDVELAARDGGGCAALVRLPAEAPAQVEVAR
jgi:two-component system, NtrC family, sensor histidine kinase HydH